MLRDSRFAARHTSSAWRGWLAGGMRSAGPSLTDGFTEIQPHVRLQQTIDHGLMHRTTIQGDYGLGYFEGNARGDKLLEMTV